MQFLYILTLTIGEEETSIEKKLCFQRWNEREINREKITDREIYRKRESGRDREGKEKLRMVGI